VSEELRAVSAFVLAAGLTLVLVPAARRLAVRTDFLDHPVDYKAHGSATPYLGGAGVIGAFAIVALLFGDAFPTLGLVLGLALALAAMGALDDRRSLSPALRFGVQLLAGLVLWLDGIHWEVFGTIWLDLPITLIWVAGICNAFNLLDNIDGAAATTVTVAAAGIGVLALGESAWAVAAVAFALSGACFAFLIFNLSRPAKIFLGDGGSLPLGFLIAALAMLVPGSLGNEAILAAVPLAGIAIFDTTLVVLSRTRRGVSVLTGGRDHVTHRLLAVLGDTRWVALLLALVQAVLCALAVLMHDLSGTTLVAVAAGYVLVAAALLAVLEHPRVASRTRGAQSA
jgi:UDP-GlcNAc:undecaprenyl-phosphate/decaprenyl-phosphate GlcNAc-1-phosphate transferase